MRSVRQSVVEVSSTLVLRLLPCLLKLVNHVDRQNMPHPLIWFDCASILFAKSRLKQRLQVAAYRNPMYDTAALGWDAVSVSGQNGG